MNLTLDVFVNDPFDASLLKDLFQTQEDMNLANPFASFPFVEKEWSQKFAENPESCSLIFEIEGRIVGHTSFIPKEEELYLCFVILHEQFRGKNLSKEMLRLSEEFCRLNYPHEELFLNVNRGNFKAQSLYQNVGFEIVEELEQKLRMRKIL